MTFNQLASLIAKAEGKKHQASIGDVREILSILRSIIMGETEAGRGGAAITALFFRGGPRRAKAKKKIVRKKK